MNITVNRVINRFSTGILGNMLISATSTQLLRRRMNSGRETFCSGLFLSARWFVVSQAAEKGIHLIVLPTRETAEYCSSDLYNLVEGDRVFFLPDSGGAVERSNYKSSLGVQRTAAVGKIMDPGEDTLFIVTYPEALEELVPEEKKLAGALFTIRTGEEISYEKVKEILGNQGFERVDFVSAPGQYAIRGAVIDIFSYSLEYPDIVAGNPEEGGVSILTLLKKDTTVWLDSSDMYRDRDFFPQLTEFRHIYLDIPLSRQNEESVAFYITPQPVFNKNFELLLSDIRTRMENGYKVQIFGEKEAQLERLRSIILQDEHALLPEFVKGKVIHAGFIDNQDKVCCYSDHEIFDRFHRVRLRRTVEKSEQLTLNDLSAFNIGDYIVHIDHGVGVFGGLVKMADDKGRIHEVVKLMSASAPRKGRCPGSTNSVPRPGRR